MFILENVSKLELSVTVWPYAVSMCPHIFETIC